MHYEKKRPLLQLPFPSHFLHEEGGVVRGFHLVFYWCFTANSCDSNVGTNPKLSAELRVSVARAGAVCSSCFVPQVNFFSKAACITASRSNALLHLAVMHYCDMHNCDMHDCITASRSNALLRHALLHLKSGMHYCIS